MAFSSPRPCLKPGCGKLVRVRPSYCEEHMPRDERSGSYAQRSGVRQKSWDDARSEYLRRNPCCAEHLRQVPLRRERATVVDHIVPHRGNLDLFWDESNWQSLCHRCHNAKTAREDGGFGNERK